MKFNSPQTDKVINLIYGLLQKENRTAYELAEEMCCNRQTVYLYLHHMLEHNMVKEVQKVKKVSIYAAVAGATLPTPPQPDEDMTEARREARDAKKKQIKLSQIKPWRDPLLFILFGKTE
jgi:hypothetical protein